jgi:hypothetical protein
MAILGYTSALYSQEFNLEINSKKKTENIFLSKINYNKKHKDSAALFNEIYKVQKKLKKNGYFLITIDSVLHEDKKYIAYLHLNQKIDSVNLKYKNAPALIIQKYNFKNNILQIPINLLEKILNEISSSQELKGNAFSKINLYNFEIKNKTLFADINFTPSKKRKIDKVIFKGYENFPQSFIKNHLNINTNSVFNKKKLQEISQLSQALDFASEIKPPETLFTQDSTFVYIYLKKIKGNSFNGLINFTSQENGKLKFNGHLDLKFKNILNKGENLNLLWNSFGDERQEFSIAAKTPYVFNSKITTEVAFSIYKQDSTFLNTTLNANLNYKIKNNANLYASFSSENSKNTLNDLTNNISTYKNYFLGFGYEYKVAKNDVFKNNLYYLNINPSFGKRKTTNGAFQQIKITTTVSYLLDLNRKNSIYFSNKTGVLNSENYLDNELFRIGGNNSIRGFKEQSIFVKNYLLQNIEYRYLTSKKSYLYTITDLALISTPSSKERLYGFGLGYLFNTNNSQINISSAIGTNSKNPINTEDIQLFVNWTNFF